MSTSIFFDLISDFKFMLGMACNLLALYLILRKSKEYLSEYRKLLVIFLGSDMIFALLHAIAKPVGVIEGNLSLMYLTGHIRHRYLMAIYLSCVSGSFPILSFHFVYRALAIRSSTFSFGKLTAKMLALILAFIFAFMVSWATLILSFEYRTSYGDSARTHFATYNLSFPDNPKEELILFLAYEDGEINVPALKRIVLIIAVTAFTGFFIIVSIVVFVWFNVYFETRKCRIIGTLRTRTKANYYWRKIHLQLFIALLVQLLIPCICLYIPTTFYLLVVFVPHSSVHTPPRLLADFYSWFPIADPIAIILLISDYRRTLTRPLIQMFKKASGFFIHNSAVGPMEAINSHVNSVSSYVKSS